jgi:chromosomal replication initiator protein
MRSSKFSISARPITQQERAALDTIWNVVADEFQVPLEIISSHRRFREWATPRFVLMYMAKIYTPIGLNQIGEYCGNRDHSSIVHGQQAASNLEDTNKRMKAKIEAIRAKLDVIQISHASLQAAQTINKERHWETAGYL